MEALVVSGPPSTLLTTLIDGAQIVDPEATETPDIPGDTRVIVGVNDAMVLSGWLASEAFQSLTARHESGEIRVLAVQLENAPCALVPSTVPLIPEDDLGGTLDEWRDGQEPTHPRPPAARYASSPHALAWEQLAVRAASENYETVAKELALPLGVPTPGALIDGRFRVLSPGPTTALFAQWEVQDRSTHALCTLFVLHPHEAAVGESLHSTTDAWAALDHPAIGAVLGTGVLPDGRGWYARAGTSASSLTSRIEEQSLSQDDRLLILLDIAEGLAAVHAKGLVHGGLDPARVWVRANGSAALTDLGIMGLGLGAAPNSVYTAPERLDPTAELEPTNDVYGLAVLAMLAIHGETLPYWVARDPARMVASLDVSTDLGSVLQSSLSWDPERRPDSVLALRDALLTDVIQTERLARHALSRDRDDTAEALLEQLISDGADGPEIDSLQLSLARKRASRGDPEVAVQTLKGLAEGTKHPADLWLEIANLQHSHQLPGAVESWEKALDTHQSRAQAGEALRGLAANDEERFLRWGRALALYTEDEEHTALAHRLGKAFHATGDEAAALLWLDRAAAGGRSDPELLSLRERIRAARGEWSDVVELMVGQAEQGIGDPVELLAKAAKLARRATPDPQPVAELYEKLLAIAPDHLDAHRHLARHRTRAGDTKAALTHFEALCSHADAVAADHCGHARLLLREGRREQAREAATQALRLEPSHEVAHRVARRAAQECGAFTEAASHQDRIVELNASTDGGGHADRLVRAGDLYRFDGQEERALERYDEAIAFTPNHLGAWWGIYAVERSRSADQPPAPLCFGPEEALARLLAEMLQISSVYDALSTDAFGTALGERCTPTEPWTIFVAVVDTLSYHEAIGPELFDRLLDCFPERSERIVAVRNLWSGAANLTASFPVAECMGWSEDGSDFNPELHRELVFRAGWPRESASLSMMLDRLMVRDEPLAALPPHSDPGDDEDLLLEAPETPMLVIGEGAAATHHEVETSLTLGPDDAPGLLADLSVDRHGDRLYLSVSEGSLEREGERAREFLLHGGDLLTWRGVRIRFYRVQDRDALDPIEPTDAGATVDVAIANIVDPIPADTLGNRAAMLFDDGHQKMAVPLESPETAVVEQVDGSLVFTTTVPEHYLAVVLFRHGHHYIEQELTNATGFGGRLSARSMEHDEVVMIGSTPFQYRKSPSLVMEPREEEGLLMPEPSLAPRPMLILQDGSLLGQPVPLTEGLFRIGRGRACELQIRTDALLSRVHCRIHGEEGGWFLEDAGSSNGTRVNDAIVRGRHPLIEGDIIEIGHTQIDFTLGRVRIPEPAEVAEEVDALFAEEAETHQPDPIESETQVVNPADLDEAMKAATLSPWTQEQAQEKIRVANRAFRVLFSALDDEHGAGRGRAELQLLVDAKPREHHGLLDGLELEEAVLPAEPVLMALEDRPESERRQLLSTMLLHLIDTATDVVCNSLTEKGVEVVLSRMAHLGHRRSLQLD